ncbi:MAG: hypothetical protein KIT83_18790 [Bryobacterales bacterium]|nr:hypothetical protein [Bryobacterales bacterium]
MNDVVGLLDYGEDLVWRYRSSGRTRKEIAAEAGIAVTTLDYYIRRVNRSSSAEEAAVSRILPVELVTGEHEETAARGAQSAVVVRLGNGRVVEVHRVFDAQLLRDLLAVLETSNNPEYG